MKKELPEAGLAEKEAYLSGVLDVFIVEGNSMLTVLKSGDCVFVDPKLEPEIGDIILFHHPFIQNKKLVKRIAEITTEGNFIVLGDNPPESTDSRSFGAILPKNILGVVVYRFDGE